MDRLESFGQVRDIDVEQGRVSAVISTGDIARDNAIIDPKGWDFTYYDLNPVVLWMHDASMPPFARTIQHRATKSELKATAQFDLEDPFAKTILRKIEQGYVNATSVRWLPKRTEWREVKETDEAGDTVKRKILVFLEQELLEFSFVTVPADPKALIMRADGRGLDLAELAPVSRPHAGGIELDDPNVKVVNCRIHGHPDEGEEYDPERPYANEHACRLRDPKAFQPKRFRRVGRVSGGKRYFIIMGRLKGETTMTEQAYRYPKDVWSAAQARGHCKEHDGKLFEPAAASVDSTGPLRIVETRLSGLLARKLERRSVDDMIVAALAKETGKSEERIRQELARGGFA